MARKATGQVTAIGIGFSKNSFQIPAGCSDSDSTDSPAVGPLISENQTKMMRKRTLPLGMSAVGGGADVVCQELSGPFIATSGHSSIPMQASE